MRSLCRIIGFVWIGVVVLAGLTLGIGQAFLGYPGLIFQSGFGDIYLLALIGMPGFGLYSYGSKEE